MAEGGEMNYLEEYKVNVPEGKSGIWYVEKFEVKEDSIGRISYMLHGRDVPPGIYTRLCREKSFDNPVMSDTPSEIGDHLHFIHTAHGNCLINGLGLGVVVNALLHKPEVTHIDVVEIEQDVINLVWPAYNNGKTTLYHADALTTQWPKDQKWDCAWHDIWPSMCTDNLPEIAKLKHKYARRVKYQAAWAEDELRYRHRQERQSIWY